MFKYFKTLIILLFNITKAFFFKTNNKWYTISIVLQFDNNFAVLRMSNKIYLYFSLKYI